MLCCSARSIQALQAAASPIYNCIAQAIPDFIDVYSLSAEESADGKPLYSLAGRSYADSGAWIFYNIKGRLYFIATPGSWTFDSMQTGREICMIADSAPDVKTFTKRFDELGTLLQAIRT